jgi:hypothetical protein
VKIRLCLKCEEAFVSAGNQNRLCELCNEDNRTLSGPKGSVPLDVLRKVICGTEVSVLFELPE